MFKTITCAFLFLATSNYSFSLNGNSAVKEFKYIAYSTFATANGDRLSLIIDGVRRADLNYSSDYKESWEDYALLEQRTLIVGTIIGKKTNLKPQSGVFELYNLEAGPLLTGDTGFFFELDSNLVLVLTDLDTIWWPIQTNFYLISIKDGKVDLKNIGQLPNKEVTGVAHHAGTLYFSGIGGTESFFADEAKFDGSTLSFVPLELVCYTPVVQDTECKEESTHPWKETRKQLERMLESEAKY